MTARLLLLAALACAGSGAWLLGLHRTGYGIALLAAAWFAGALFAALRIGRFAAGVERDAQDARWVAGIGCGCGGWCTDCDLRGDDR